jgi:hypothetical protein
MIHYPTLEIKNLLKMDKIHNSDDVTMWFFFYIPNQPDFSTKRTSRPNTGCNKNIVDILL